ncbi:uncharacterized protein BDR25DRAFT_350263 [Lindgomyces ingoldianus]|uniref:Uncharacterized protein n=1 Tax=Lindgomyces ingoldianus TaxID=673940 RepID=A0ACB6R9H9_9PLEO|nr:uncharacterized protein BDR25DRAFT_350263 [Lindgomyces ingoldianus]KAF2475984.1 hypothetical protein BDR25DRAFT_350263 [Lindgomyces ingoldianus]
MQKYSFKRKAAVANYLTKTKYEAKRSRAATCTLFEPIAKGHEEVEAMASRFASASILRMHDKREDAVGALCGSTGLCFGTEACDEEGFVASLVVFEKVHSGRQREGAIRSGKRELRTFSFNISLSSPNLINLISPNFAKGDSNFRTSHYLSNDVALNHSKLLSLLLYSLQDLSAGITAGLALLRVRRTMQASDIPTFDTIAFYVGLKRASDFESTNAKSNRWDRPNSHPSTRRIPALFYQ